ADTPATSAPAGSDRTPTPPREWADRVAQDEVVALLSGTAAGTPATPKLLLAPPLGGRGAEPVPTRGFGVVSLPRATLSAVAYDDARRAFDPLPSARPGQAAADLRGGPVRRFTRWTRSLLDSPRDMAFATIFAIALLFAFLTVAKLWRIEDDRRAVVRADSSAGAGAGGTAQASTTVTTAVPGGSIFEGNLARTVWSGLTGIAAVTLLTQFWQFAGVNAEALYVVVFVVAFLVFLVAAALVRATVETVRSRVLTSRPPPEWRPPTRRKGTANEVYDRGARKAWGMYWARRGWRWWLSQRETLLVFSDTFTNVVMGRSYSSNVVWEDKIVDMQLSMLRASDRVREEITTAVQRALGTAYSNRAAASTTSGSSPTGGNGSGSGGTTAPAGGAPGPSTTPGVTSGQATAGAGAGGGSTQAGSEVDGAAPAGDESGSTAPSSGENAAAGEAGGAPATTSTQTFTAGSTDTQAGSSAQAGGSAAAPPADGATPADPAADEAAKAAADPLAVQQGIRVAISVLGDDGQSVFYISSAAGSLAKQFGRESVAWVAASAGEARWWLESYRQKHVVVFDNTTGTTLPDVGGVKLRLDDYFQKREHTDYKAFLLIPIPWRRRDLPENTRRGAIHISFAHREWLEQLWPVIRDAMKTALADPARHTKNDEGVVTEVDPYNDWRTLLDYGAITDPGLQAVLHESVNVLAELISQFDQTIYESRLRKLRGG
ncbi:MAG TPA: hypothetical protein VFS20_11680, partial [Longimicrobium sp.]|nr:hypothetical protein [Longimicrobium sp.]